MGRRWVRRPPGSNWGDFGDDDQLGRLNLLTPAKVLEGIAQVKAGLSFCLSLPLNYPGGSVANPRRHPPQLFAAVEGDRAIYNAPLSVRFPGAKAVICDDSVLLSTQYSTQWDSLAHVGNEFDADDDGVAEIVYYNGWRGGEHIVLPPADPNAPAWARYPGVHADALGIETMARTGVQGRGVIVDLFAEYGRAHQRVGFADLMRIMERDGVTVEPGDMLCLYTGFDELLLEMNREPVPALLHHSCAGLDGGDERLLEWVTTSGVAAIISDNRAVETLPPRRGPESSSLHEHCLFKLGIPLGEQWFLSELNGWLQKNRRCRFLLTAPPLRLPGAVGSPVTPVATV